MQPSPANARTHTHTHTHTHTPAVLNSSSENYLCLFVYLCFPVFFLSLLLSLNHPRSVIMSTPPLHIAKTMWTPHALSCNALSRHLSYTTEWYFAEHFQFLFQHDDPPHGEVVLQTDDRRQRQFYRDSVFSSGCSTSTLWFTDSKALS